MKLTHLFYFNSIVVLNALIALVAPELLLERVGIPADNPDILQFANNAGGLLLFVGLVSWFAARTEDSPFRRKIRLSFFIMNLVMTVFHYLAYLNGGQIVYVYGHGFLTLAYGYFQFIKPDA